MQLREQIEKSHHQATPASTDLIAERGKTHGDFAANAAFVIPLFRKVLDKGASDTMTLGLLMVILKLSRIVEGDELHEDHYVDIANYAQLILNNQWKDQ
jgi:hypothetical protein